MKKRRGPKHQAPLSSGLNNQRLPEQLGTNSCPSIRGRREADHYMHDSNTTCIELVLVRSNSLPCFATPSRHYSDGCSSNAEDVCPFPCRSCRRLLHASWKSLEDCHQAPLQAVSDSSSLGLLIHDWFRISHSRDITTMNTLADQACNMHRVSIVVKNCNFPCVVTKPTIYKLAFWPACPARTSPLFSFFRHRSIILACGFSSINGRHYKLWDQVEQIPHLFLADLRTTCQFKMKVLY